MSIFSEGGSAFKCRYDAEQYCKNIRQSGIKCRPKKISSNPEYWQIEYIRKDNVGLPDGNGKIIKENEFKCPICNEPKCGSCKCPSFAWPHDMEQLKKGHGMVCKNGHNFNGDGLAYDPKEDKEYNIKNENVEMTKGRWVCFDELPTETQDDIVGEISEKYNEDARDIVPELKDLAKPPKFLIRNIPIDNITGYDRNPSGIAVDKYMKMLEGGTEAPPILVDGNKFVDGGHRYMAYRKAGRKTIPTIDVGRILKKWPEWSAGKANELETEIQMNEFDRYYNEVLKRLDEEDAGAMGGAAYVRASVDTPASPDAIYTVARPYSGKGKKKGKKGRKAGNVLMAARRI